MFTPEIDNHLDNYGDPGPVVVDRKPVGEMTERELLEEFVTRSRQWEDALISLQSHPMFAAMAAGQNPIMAMMGRG